MRLYYFDDSGSRTNNDNQPYFILAGYGIDADDISGLQERVYKVAKSYGMELRYPVELKASHAGNIRKKDKNWMVQAGLTEIHQRRALLLTVLRELRGTESLKCIVVAVANKSYEPHKPKKKNQQTGNPKNIIVDAMRLAMERVELDLRDHNDVGCVFLDEERGSESGLRDEFRFGSKFIQRKSIIETPGFVPSEESVGIQLADLIAGGVSRWINSSDPGYARHIWPKLRTHRGRIAGVGLKVVPQNAILHPPNTQHWGGNDKIVLEEMYQHVPQELQWRNGVPFNSQGAQILHP